MMVRFWPIFTCLMLMGMHAYAQLGGQQAFSFLLFPTSARQMALGGYHISSSEQDPNMWLASPAFLADSIGGSMSLLYGGHYAGMKYGTFAYAHALKQGSLGAGIQYMHSGQLDQYDPSGKLLGQFSASQYAVNIGYARRWGVYASGATLKLVQSQLAGYAAMALMLDWGGAFIHPTKDLKVALAIKNIGFPIQRYVGGQPLNLPLDAQLGISFKPKRMPLRLSATAHHLQRFHIAYEDLTDQGTPDFLGEPIDNRIPFAGKLIRHFAFGSELVLGRFLRLRLGYSLLERQDASLPTAKGSTGISWGMAFYSNKLRIELSRGNRFIGGGYTALGLSFRPGAWSYKTRAVE